QDDQLPAGVGIVNKRLLRRFRECRMDVNNHSRVTRKLGGHRLLSYRVAIDPVRLQLHRQYLNRYAIGDNQDTLRGEHWITEKREQKKKFQVSKYARCHSDTLSR